MLPLLVIFPDARYDELLVLDEDAERRYVVLPEEDEVLREVFGADALETDPV